MEHAKDPKGGEQQAKEPKGGEEPAEEPKGGEEQERLLHQQEMEERECHDRELPLTPSALDEALVTAIPEDVVAIPLKMKDFRIHCVAVRRQQRCGDIVQPPKPKLMNETLPEELGAAGSRTGLVERTGSPKRPKLKFHA